MARTMTTREALAETSAPGPMGSWEYQVWFGNRMVSTDRATHMYWRTAVRGLRRGEMLVAYASERQETMIEVADSAYDDASDGRSGPIEEC